MPHPVPGIPTAAILRVRAFATAVQADIACKTYLGYQNVDLSATQRLEKELEEAAREASRIRSELRQEALGMPINP